MPDAVKTGPPPTRPEPARKEEPKAPKPVGERSILPFVIGAVVVAGVLGVVLGGSGGGGDGGGGGSAVARSNADLSVSVPSGYTETPAPAIPGLKLQNPISFASAAGGPGVVAGIVPSEADNFALLTNEMAAAIGADAIKARKAVELSGSDLQAYAYENVTAKGFDGSLTVYAAPTSAGVATVACYAPAAAAAGFADECGSVANSLELTSGAGIPVGPSTEYAEQLSGILGTLDKAVKAGLDDLKVQRTQASGAASIERAYTTAAAAVGDLEVRPADKNLNDLLANALDQASAAYGKLASAAKASNRSAYSAAQKSVATANGEIQGALSALAAAGYTTQ